MLCDAMTYDTMAAALCAATAAISCPACRIMSEYMTCKCYPILTPQAVMTEYSWLAGLSLAIYRTADAYASYC
jgi:hypothetical protein